jgi:hypothetical protein
MSTDKYPMEVLMGIIGSIARATGISEVEVKWSDIDDFCVGCQWDIPEQIAQPATDYPLVDLLLLTHRIPQNQGRIN